MYFTLPRVTVPVLSFSSKTTTIPLPDTSSHPFSNLDKFYVVWTFVRWMSLDNQYRQYKNTTISQLCIDVVGITLYFHSKITTISVSQTPKWMEVWTSFTSHSLQSLLFLHGKKVGSSTLGSHSCQQNFVYIRVR